MEFRRDTHVGVTLKSSRVDMSSSNRVEIGLGDSGEVGGDVLGFTLISHLGATFKNRILSRLPGGRHGLGLNIYALIDTSIT